MKFQVLGRVSKLHSYGTPRLGKKSTTFIFFVITWATVDQFSLFSLLTSEKICGGSLNCYTSS